MGIIDTNSDEIIRTVNLWNLVLVKGLTIFHQWSQKKVINELFVPLSIIFNKSFKLGQFPDKLEIAKIIHILKREDKS